jgi:hypothetical protein
MWLLIFWTIVRVLTALVGAYFGSLVAGLVVRLLARLVSRRAAPRPVVGLARLAGAVAVGLLIYYFLHPGGGGGWGLGGGSFGLGGGTGKGRTGTAAATTAPTTAEKNNTAKTTPSTSAEDTLTIEMLGGARYKGAGRYYLIGSQEPARDLHDVEDFLQKKQGRYRRLEILIYPDSVASVSAPVTQLAELARRRGFALSITRAPK